jgi:hypothetical protein
MSRITVRYGIEGVIHARNFDTMDEAEEYVSHLLEMYGDEYIQGLTVEKQD